MKENIHLFYTNDLHSHFEHWPQVATYLKAERLKKREENKSCWLVDIGDHMDRVNPITEAYMGKANVQLLNDLSYDLITIGNNEGITMAYEDLYELYDEASFKVVCSNLYSQRLKQPTWLHTSTQLTSKQGVNVGVLGLTAPFNAFYHLLGWHVEQPFTTLEKYLQPLKETCDVIILLSHLGLNEDRAIARHFPDIDVIIGGHTHHLLRSGEKVNETLITAAGKHCMFVGEVILTWDHAKQKLINMEAYTTDITHLPKDLTTEQKLNELEEEATRILEQPVVTIQKPLEVNWFKATNIMQKLTDMLTSWTGADCGMLNAGLLLDQFAAGDITYKDIHRICPHPINPCVVELNGDELLEVIRGSLSKDFTELQLKGFGFRGEVLGRMVFAKLHVKTEVHKNGEEYVKSVSFNNKPLQPHATYKVATADTFTFGRLLPQIDKAKSKQYYVPEFIRDLLVKTLQYHFEK